MAAHAEVDHAMELPATGLRIGHLLTSQVTEVSECLDTLPRIANGGSALDTALGPGGRAGPPT